MVVGLINENLGGHGSFHSRLVAELSSFSDLSLCTLNVPDRGWLREALTTPLPLPAGWDFDAPLFRNQVGQSLAVRTELRKLVTRCDVLHLYTQNACPLSLRHLRLVPYVVTTDAACSQVEEMFPFRYPGRGAALGRALSSWAERRLLREAAAVVAQSDWARAALIQSAGIEPDRVHTIRIGAPSPGPVIERPTRRPRVVFVGATMTRKGGWALLRMLDAQIGRSLDLVLVTRERVPGRPGLEVRNDVRQGDGQIERILEDSDIFALPTDIDMSPNAVLEAMAAGLPVVTYRCGGLAEMVDHGASGYVLPPGDERGFTEAIAALVESPSRRKEFGDEGRRILSSRFDRRSAASTFRDVLRRAGQR